MPLPRVHFWNLTPRALKYARANALVVSIPKSGRTWLRFFLRHYLSSRAGLAFSIRPSAAERRAVPDVQCAHDLWEHLTTPRRWDRLRGRYLIPAGTRRRARIVLAVRDLRDVMVSLHMQLTKRGFASGARFDGTLKQLIRHPAFGAERAVEIQNHWLAEWRDSGRFHLWVYEECRKDPERAFRAVLEFLDPGPLREDLLQQSLEFASFDSMRAMERENRFDHVILRPGDPADPDSYKVRRGVVGGWRDYLDAEDEAFVARAAARLRL
jgi:hypothetical protein